MAAIQFNPNEHEANQAYEPLPAAWYSAVIIASDYKQCGQNAKDPNGFYYSFTFQIVDGVYRNRQIYANYNVVNANSTAVDIANGDLSAIYTAIGALTEDIKDTAQLHNRPMEIKLKITPARGDYEPGNAITAYRAPGGEVSATTAPPVTAPPPAAAPPVTSPPVTSPPGTSLPVTSPAAPTPPGVTEGAPPQMDTGTAKPPWEQ